MSIVDSDDLRRVVATATGGVPYWGTFFESLGSLNKTSIGIHLAILVEPYLEFVLQGKKTIESRFSVNRVAPYARVVADDVIFLKRAGGPIVGICQVMSAWFYRLGPDSFEEIERRFGKAICPVDEEFWTDRRHTEYATLIKLSRVHRIEPVAFPKKDRRGWVVLKPSRLQDELLMRPMIIGLAGPIGSGKTTLGRELAESLSTRFASFGDVIRGIARKRGISATRENLQRLGQRLVEEDPVQLCRAVLADVGWQPGMGAVIEGFRHLSVVDAFRELIMPVAFKLVYIDIDMESVARRKSIPVGALTNYQMHMTEIELPILRDIADYKADGSFAVDQLVSSIRKALGFDNAK